MKKKLYMYMLLGIVFLLSSEFSYCQTNPDLSRAFDSLWNSWKDSINNDFNTFSVNNEKAFNEFKKAIEDYWGTGGFVTSDSTTWVEYYDQNQSRSKVNFENNTAEIEILVNPDEAVDKELIEEKVKSVIEDLALNQGKTIDYDTPSEKSEPLGNRPVLEEQLITSGGETVNENNVEKFSNEVIRNTEINRTEVIGNDGVNRIKLSLTIPLAPNSIQVRANKILPIIRNYCTERNLEPELVLAIIHIESYFNPKAVSRAYAIGLMQLVPSSGGLDAYRKIYGINVKPTMKYLLNPENNINMGTAYIQILMDNYLKNVNNSESQRYCCIASYNTGPGNLSYAYINSMKISNAIPYINQKSPEENYNFLTTSLKYKEAREYLKKVNEKYFLYKNWVNK